jgi:hypothetical protein
VVTLPGGRLETLGKCTPGASKKNQPEDVEERWHRLDRQRTPADMLFADVAVLYLNDLQNPSTRKSASERASGALHGSCRAVGKVAGMRAGGRDSRSLRLVNSGECRVDLPLRGAGCRRPIFGESRTAGCRRPYADLKTKKSTPDPLEGSRRRPLFRW